MIPLPENLSPSIIPYLYISKPLIAAAYPLGKSSVMGYNYKYELFL
jgi:hypothetical protein